MTAFDVKIGDTLYALVRDPAHVHPPELHAHLGTTGEAGIRRVLDAVEADDWFDGEGNYIGRDVIGIGILSLDLE